MGISDRKSRERIQRENMILDAAEQVFFSRGFDNSTMDDVATAAELSKGSLYNYFKNKNELCIAIVSRSLRTIIKYMEKAAAKNGSGLDRLVETIKAFRLFCSEEPQYHCALQNYREHRCGCGNESKFLNLTLSENQQISNIMAETISAGIADGSIKKDIIPEKTAMALWGEANGILPGFDPKSGAPDIFEYAIELIINGLKN